MCVRAYIRTRSLSPASCMFVVGVGCACLHVCVYCEILRIQNFRMHDFLIIYRVGARGGADQTKRKKKRKINQKTGTLFSQRLESPTYNY